MTTKYYTQRLSLIEILRFLSFLNISDFAIHFRLSSIDKILRYIWEKELFDDTKPLSYSQFSWQQEKKINYYRKNAKERTLLPKKRTGSSVFFLWWPNYDLLLLKAQFTGTDFSHDQHHFFLKSFHKLFSSLVSKY